LSTPSRFVSFQQNAPLEIANARCISTETIVNPFDRPNLNGTNAMLRRVGLGLLLGAGVAGVASAQGSGRFDGQYMGELTLTRVVSGDCTEPPLGALYPLAISRGEVRFAYVPRFATTLSGRVDKNGVFKASARLHRGVVQMTGRVQGNNLSAQIVSPSCHYTFQTKN
jgi:hypothetical protein